MAEHRSPDAYGHALYAASLEEWGEPIELRRSATWLVVRSIPGSDLRDAMGVYPFTSSPDWASVCRDVAGLPEDIVTVTLVTDPFAQDVAGHLSGCFDGVRPFKDHFVADLAIPSDERVSRHHRRRAKRALGLVGVTVIERPIDHLDEWWELYQNLARRHGLKGIKAFSRRSFERQLQVPGLVAFRAHAGAQSSGIALWYQDGDHAYGHLVALSAAGYDDGASYALDWFACEWFADRCRWLDFGGVPDAGTNRGQGLHAYKRGWCTGTASTLLCTLVRDQAAYQLLTASLGGSERGYFPAYRDGELL